MDQLKVLEEIRAHLTGLGYPCALAGAFALNAYGLGRFTADLDLLVPHEAQDALIGRMEALGFETLYRSEGYSNHLHPDPRIGRVDFIYVEGATSEQIFSRSRSVQFPGTTEMRVPLPEHLIAMKVRAIRNDPSRRLKDLADVQFLLSLPGVDEARARRYFEAAGLEDSWNELKR